ncbi:hypothetical protein CEUSTIGMA_g5690.t1 [Chlamydomonas eustigma]|uniref:Uncharacterized protein n=1 Tax=Chlamydomonas eustigma TaxID=1157962 RepID=A0A250X5A7_9CHLO|nr:hypothetical protein CEUSTIGMA_g5690.t1 [Chlamydomonas eustigma]|eukprot:GAX78248.1 hypothetical protein CEUSTIGMA_g5690.t1 [Chlamydomonas eustigma]
MIALPMSEEDDQQGKLQERLLRRARELEGHAEQLSLLLKAAWEERDRASVQALEQKRIAADATELRRASEAGSQRTIECLTAEIQRLKSAVAEQYNCSRCPEEVLERTETCDFRAACLSRIQAKQLQVEGTLRALQQSRAAFFRHLVSLTTEVQESKVAKEELTKQLLKQASHSLNIMRADGDKQDSREGLQDDGIKDMICDIQHALGDLMEEKEALKDAHAAQITALQLDFENKLMQIKNCWADDVNILMRQMRHSHRETQDSIVAQGLIGSTATQAMHHTSRQQAAESIVSITDACDVPPLASDDSRIQQADMLLSVPCIMLHGYNADSKDLIVSPLDNMDMWSSTGGLLLNYESNPCSSLCTSVAPSADPNHNDSSSGSQSMSGGGDSAKSFSQLSSSEGGSSILLNKISICLQRDGEINIMCDHIAPFGSNNQDVLDGTSINTTDLDGTSINTSDLDGTSINTTDLDGTSINTTDLDGTSINTTDLDGTSINTTDLDGTSINTTDLDGTSINTTDLDGTSINTTDLDGTSINTTDLDGIRIDHQGPALIHMLQHIQQEDESAVMGLSNKQDMMSDVVNKASHLKLTTAMAFQEDIIGGSEIKRDDEACQSRSQERCIMGIICMREQQGQLGSSTPSLCDDTTRHPWYLTSLAALSEDKSREHVGEGDGCQMTPNPLYDCSIRSTRSIDSSRNASNLTDRQAEHVIMHVQDHVHPASADEDMVHPKCLFPSSSLEPPSPSTKMINGTWITDFQHGAHAANWTTHSMNQNTAASMQTDVIRDATCVTSTNSFSPGLSQKKVNSSAGQYDKNAEIMSATASRSALLRLRPRDHPGPEIFYPDASKMTDEEVVAYSELLKSNIMSEVCELADELSIVSKEYISKPVKQILPQGTDNPVALKSHEKTTRQEAGPRENQVLLKQHSTCSRTTNTQYEDGQAVDNTQPDTPAALSFLTPPSSPITLAAAFQYLQVQLQGAQTPTVEDHRVVIVAPDSRIMQAEPFRISKGLQSQQKPVFYHNAEISLSQPMQQTATDCLFSNSVRMGRRVCEEGTWNLKNEAVMGDRVEESLATTAVQNQAFLTPTTRTHHDGYESMTAITPSSMCIIPVTAVSIGSSGERSRKLSPTEFAALPSSLKQYAPPSLHRMFS